MTLRIGDTGPEVVRLRQDLAEANPELMSSSPSPTVFDAQLDTAVRGLQERYELTQDGVVGPRTLRALQAEMADLRSPEPDYVAMDALPRRTAMFARAALRARIREVPLGSNRGPTGPSGGVDAFLTWFGDGETYLKYEARPNLPQGWRGAPWCAAFIAWCAAQAAKDIGADFVLRSGTDLMGCRKWHTAGKKHGLVLAQPEPGCVGLVARNGKLAHAVLITRVDPDGVWSVEGNGYGERVRAVKRQPSAFGALVRLG